MPGQRGIRTLGINGELVAAIGRLGGTAVLNTRTPKRRIR